MTGEDAFRHLHGAGVWDWRAERPEEAEIFDASMTEMSRGVADAIGEAVDFSGFECIVDVGGGRGVLLAGILKRNPGSRGILYDLPHVVAGAPPVLRAQGVSRIAARLSAGTCSGRFLRVAMPMSSSRC